MSSQYITNFLDAVAADLAGLLEQEQITAIRETMEPFVPIVLAHALRLSDLRLTSFADSSGGWVDYCYTGPGGMVIKLNYPNGTAPDTRPASYSVPYSVFFSDADMGEWRAARDAEYAAQLAAEAAAAAAAIAAAAAATKRTADLAKLAELIALYGVPEA